MGVNLELNALQKEVTRQRILEAGFRIFAEKSIDKVTMNDVAEAAGIGVATVYRYYSNKTLLALGVSGWAWEKYVEDAIKNDDAPHETAAQRFEFFLETFLDLYRNHKDLLRFNQFYNIFVGQEMTRGEAIKPYETVVKLILDQFRQIYAQAQVDHTLRTDVSMQEMLFSSLHLMLAAITRYAVGLVYEGGQDPERELVLLKNMLLKQYQA